MQLGRKCKRLITNIQYRYLGIFGRQTDKCLFSEHKEKKQHNNQLPINVAAKKNAAIDAFMHQWPLSVNNLYSRIIIAAF